MLVAILNFLRAWRRYNTSLRELYQLGDRVLLSPHSASYTEGGELRQGVAWATRSVVTALKGGIPDNVYNRDVIPRWKERFGGASAAGA